MVIFGKNTESTDYIDKALLLDLSPHFGDRLLGCARSAYTTDTGEQYLIPLTMQAELFASAVLDENLTWDILQAMTDELSNNAMGQQAVTSYDISHDLMALSLFDFYDTEAQSASFDTDAFRDRIRLLDTLKTRGIVDAYGYFGNGYSTNFRYGIAGSGAIVNAVRTGDVRLLYVPFYSIGAYPALKRIFEDTPFTLCGYPTVDGNTPCVSVNSQNMLGVFADSDSLGGCSTFLAFLLSDEVQGAEMLTHSALPVTHSGFAAALEDYRYTYYSTMGSKNDLEPYDHSAVQMPDYLTFGYYSECTLSDGDLADILSFFDSCTSRAAPDATIAQIITEELSAYESGAKTLEEVTRLMQSRVSIYLNE